MMTVSRRYAPLSLLVLVFVLAGCAALFPRPEPPRVTLADLRLVELKLLEQRYRLFLRVQNPNAFDLSIDGVDYELTLNEQEFGSGVSNRPVSVPAYGTEILEVDAYSTLAGLFRQLRELDPARPFTLRYRLKGHVRLSSGGPQLPFDHSGELSLGAGRGREGITL
jgi:LEA14-like dessication related protein